MGNYQNTFGDWLRYRFHLLVNDLISGITRPLYYLHCVDLLPMWVVNLPYCAIPETLRQKAVQAHFLRFEAKQKDGAL